MKKNIIFSAILLVLICVISSCKKDKTADPSDPDSSSSEIVVTGTYTQKEILEQSVVVNPSGFAPLTALINLKTSEPAKIQLRVIGKKSPENDVVYKNDTLKTNHVIQVFGLYGNYNTIVQLTLLNASGQTLGSSAIYIKTEELSSDLPTVEINTSTASKKSGMNLVSYLAYNTQSSPVKPFIFDAAGDIRWYLDYTTSEQLKNLNYDDGITRLKNGNFYFGNINSSAIYEVNMFGEILNTWPFPEYNFHHNVLEKPNGNFLASVSKIGASTVEDYIIEIDRNSKQIVTTWDLKQSLQYSRTTLTTDGQDWIHVNALAYDASDNTLIVSGRTQGVFKLDQNNKVVWILGPHKGWGISGNGMDLTTKLLQPLDNNNAAISDTSVLMGYTNHSDFEWNWYQHSVKLNPNGDLYLFDNGDNRNYVSTGPYSRAVEFKIDAAAMTVKQIWQYGKSRGEEVYSRIVSEVDYYQDVDHYIMSPGASAYNGQHGKVIEIINGSSTVVFEATIHPPSAYAGSITFHRTDRLELYPSVTSN